MFYLIKKKQNRQFYFNIPFNVYCKKIKIIQLKSNLKASNDNSRVCFICNKQNKIFNYTTRKKSSSNLIQ